MTLLGVGRLLARLKMKLCRHMLLSEFCRDCGCRVEQIWRAPDPLWLTLNKADFDRDPDFFPPLCMRCFDRRSRSAGMLLRWRCEVDA